MEMKGTMNLKVVSLGELVVEFFRKEVDKPFHEQGEFVGPFPSGAPAIFVDALAKLGCECGIIGTIGDDDFGRCLTDRLKKDGVDTSRIFVLPSYATGTAFTAYFSDGSRSFLYSMRHAAPGQFSIEHIDPNYISQVEFLHIMGNVLCISESSKEACYLAVKIVEEAGGKISFDPNLRPELGFNSEKIRQLCKPILEVTDLFLPSEKEVEAVAGVKNVKEACQKSLDEGVNIVALKQGKRGSTVFTKEMILEVPGFKVVEVDPTGAGDCYDAGFIFGLLKEWSTERTARFANAVGALAVTKLGTMEGTATFSEVVNFMGKFEDDMSVKV